MATIDALEFFTAQSRAFAETLAQFGGREELLPALLNQAYSSFAGNAEQAMRDMPQPACQPGCASCCSLRVTATAPEILLIVCFIYAQSGAEGHARQLARVTKTERVTRGLTEAQRVKVNCPCPFLNRGVCSIYPVRPLACRGHACYDRQACVDAAAGMRPSLPVCEPCRDVRCLVQIALQSALRDAGHAWAGYELIHGVALAMADPGLIRGWLRGEDVLAAARAEDMSLAEMAQTLDAIKAGMD